MLSQQDQVAIKAQVEHYFKGSYYADEAELRQAFCKDAIIAGSFDGQYVCWSLADFIQRILAAQSHKHEPFLKEIVSIEGEKDISVVKTKVQVGGNIFIDYISLIKIEGTWLIRYKSFVNIKDK